MDTITQQKSLHRSEIIHLTKQILPVSGMTCAGCALSIEFKLKNTRGVKNAGVNFATETAWVEFDATVTNPEQIKRAIKEIGFDLIIDTKEPSKKQEQIRKVNYNRSLVRVVGSGILSLPIVILGMLFMHWKPGEWISMVLSAVVLFWFGRSFFRSAVLQAKHARANMDTLVALSTGVAFIFSVFNTFYPEYWIKREIQPHVYYEAVVVIIFFISLGKILEEKAKSNTSSAIKKLIGLQPKTVRIITDEGEKKYL